MRGFRIDLASTRLAFVLLALLVVHIVAAAIIPQHKIAQDQFLDLMPQTGAVHDTIEFLRLDRIYTTWTFHVLLGLLVVNLAAGNIRRFRRVYRIERTLLRMRHLGSIIFHVALIAVLLGAIGNYLYKFQGVFALTEGQTAADGPDGYFRTFLGPLTSPRPSEFRLTMEGIDPEWEQDGVTTLAAHLRIESQDGMAVAEAVRIGHPLRWRKLEFHLGARTGFSPEVLLVGPDGSVIFRSFVRIASARHEGVDVHSDFIELPGQLTLRLEIHDSESPLPLRWVAAERADSVLFEGYVAEGDTVLVDELALSLPRMRRWAFVEARENPGVGVVFAGFWVGLAGLSLTFLARVRADHRRGEAKT
jgi:hypothetical protein